MSPTTIRYPGTRFITYRLELTTGEEPEVVRVSAMSPTYDGVQSARTFHALLRQQFDAFDLFRMTGQLQPSGSPIGPAGPIQVSGAGQEIESTPPAVMLPPSNPRRFWSCQRGDPGSLRELTVRLPAHSRTTVSARYRTSRSAPWRTTDYRLNFALHRVSVGANGRSRLEPVGVVRPPRPTRQGRNDLKLTLRSNPVLRAFLGERIDIFGRTDPPAPHRWLSSASALAAAMARTSAPRSSSPMFEPTTKGGSPIAAGGRRTSSNTESGRRTGQHQWLRPRRAAA